MLAIDQDRPVKIFLGSRTFCQYVDSPFPLYLGGMAQGISSVTLVKAASEAGYLAFFGAAGLSNETVEKAIYSLKESHAFHRVGVNFIYQPGHSEAEMQLAQLLLDHQIHAIEATAFVVPTLALSYYRAKGLRLENGKITIKNRIFAKCSRVEVFQKMVVPPQEKHLKTLLADQKISQTEYELALQVPLADAITLEADSGGHTDKQSLLALLPLIIDLKRTLFGKNALPFIGAAGGISTPQSIVAAFALGADYVVTGSINQCTVEAGTSGAVKAMLALAKISDVAMAPAADMFEMGAKVQVLKTGTQFALRSQKLWELYTQYPSLEAIPLDMIQKLEKEYFKASLSDIWTSCQAYLTEKNGQELEAAVKDDKKRMALVFRYYLGLSSKWAKEGQVDRVKDYQIWCGPSMGAFNHWASHNGLETWQSRTIAAITDTLVTETLNLESH